MSYADKVFIQNCKDIIENGMSNRGQNVRPHWPDGTPAYTVKKFGIVNRYDLRKEFPLLTLRPTAVKSAMDEVLWIYQKKSNDIKDLNSHIWDEWVGEDGTIGKAYGYQIGTRYTHHQIPKSNKKAMIDEVKYFKDHIEEYKGTYLNPSRDKKFLNVDMDQMDAVLYDIKHDPYSRRIMMNTYNFKELHEMNLYPCAYSVTLNVTQDKKGNKVLNMILNQRSQDMLAANNWNVVQYSILLMMLAQVSGMIAGELVHVIADAHIYDRHIPIVKELITRKCYQAPKVKLDPVVTNFYKFNTTNFHYTEYQHGPQVKNIPIAI